MYLSGGLIDLNATTFDADALKYKNFMESAAASETDKVQTDKVQTDAVATDVSKTGSTMMLLGVAAVAAFIFLGKKK